MLHVSMVLRVLRHTNSRLVVHIEQSHLPIIYSLPKAIMYMCNAASYKPNRILFLYRATQSGWDSINVPCNTRHSDPNGSPAQSGGMFSSRWNPSACCGCLWGPVCSVYGPRWRPVVISLLDFFIFYCT